MLRWIFLFSILVGFIGKSNAKETIKNSDLASSLQKRIACEQAKEKNIAAAAICTDKLVPCLNTCVGKKKQQACAKSCAAENSKCSKTSRALVGEHCPLPPKRDVASLKKSAKKNKLKK